MRHRRAGYRLGRTTAHRLSTLRNLACALLEHGQIVTTEQKAKAVQPFVEKIVTIAKKGDTQHHRRLVASKLGRDRKGFDWLYLPADASDQEKASVDSLKERASAFFDLPSGDKVKRNRFGEMTRGASVVAHVFENVAKRFSDRAGGYTRVVRLGRHRIGDAAELCLLQFVGAEEGPEIGGKASTRRRTADKRTAFAAKVRKAESAA